MQKFDTWEQAAATAVKEWREIWHCHGQVRPIVVCDDDYTINYATCHSDMGMAQLSEEAKKAGLQVTVVYNREKY